MPPFGHRSVPSQVPISSVTTFFSKLKNSFILPHVPVYPSSDPVARLSVWHSPFILYRQSPSTKHASASFPSAGDGHNRTTCQPSKEAGLSGLLPVHSEFLGVGTGLWASTHRGQGGGKGAFWAGMLMALVEVSGAFWPVLCVSVIFCHTTPNLFAKYLKMFPEGSELLTNLGKMLWKTPSTKTDLYS